MKEKELEDIIKTVVLNSGLNLDYIEYITQGKRWLLRVYIDREEGTVSLEDCERVSRELSRLLDDNNIIPHAYLLEVSSPGLDRPLRKLDDYRKYSGRLVRVHTTKPYDKSSNIKGRIMAVQGDNIILMTEKTGEVTINFSDIAKARLEVEF